MAGVATAGMVAAGPASAAYGDSANVFGSAKPIDQSLEIAGAGWKGQLPAKFKVSKETSEFPGTVLRYEDNFDAVTYAVVTVNSVGKNSVTEMCSIDDVRNSVRCTANAWHQSWEGSSISEGGFGDGKVSSAALLDQGQVTKDGKVCFLCLLFCGWCCFSLVPCVHARLPVQTYYQ